MQIDRLENIANNIRQSIIKMVYEAGSGHIGGSLSATEILTCLYGSEMKVDPANPCWEERDRFVLSKGHTTPVYYSTLAEFGFFSKEELQTFRRVGSCLQGHPDRKHTPGVDMSSGSLGQGVSAAVGMALGGKLSKSDFRVYTLLGDGELQEGQVWEAFMLAAHRRLDNLVVIIDNNDLQSAGHLDEVNSPYPIDDKLKAFGFYVQTIDGHQIPEILDAFTIARQNQGCPTAIIAKTVKGKGVSFMEHDAEWHGKVPNEEQYWQALGELRDVEKGGCLR